MASSTRPQARRGPSGAWNRLKPTAVDPLEQYGLPSKGETGLNDHRVQEKYYTKIVERYMKFCAASGSPEELEKAFASMSLKPPNTIAKPSQPLTSTTLQSTAPAPQPRPSLPRQPSTPSPPTDLATLHLAMRKLREAILSTHRTDAFAQRAYVFIIHATLLTHHWESYVPALTYLLHTIQPSTPLSKPELDEFVGYKILDLACRQNELNECFSVRARWRFKDRRVEGVVTALVHDDFVGFWRLKGVVDGYQRTIMNFAVERVRMHALKCLGRGYLSADRAFVERCGGAGWKELVEGGVGWELGEDGRSVVIRRPKVKDKPSKAPPETGGSKTVVYATLGEESAMRRFVSVWTGSAAAAL